MKTILVKYNPYDDPSFDWDRCETCGTPTPLLYETVYGDDLEHKRVCPNCFRTTIGRALGTNLGREERVDLLLKGIAQSLASIRIALIGSLTIHDSYYKSFGEQDD